MRASRLASTQWLTDDSEKLKSQLIKSAEFLTKEMGQLKGSAMKVGQLLSTYGENVFPKEVNDILKTLQQESPPLAWKQIEKQLRSELGSRLNELDVEQEPWASASIGQVHRARTKQGQLISLKIQYPGVDQAIDSDLRLLKILFSMTKLVKFNRDVDSIFDEVKQMLYQEMDYSVEQMHTKTFRNLLSEDQRYVVPVTFDQYCTKRVIATSFETGLKVDDEQILNLPQDRRDQLATAFLQLYLRELFEFRKVQTDPHIGNYRIRLSDNLPDQLILFDFGAVREISESFRDSYKLMVTGVIEHHDQSVIKGAQGIGLLHPDDPFDLVDVFLELCYLLSEPFSEENSANYDWNKSDLPKRAALKVSQLVLKFKLRSPPRELIFLDRKLGGVFIFLSVLRSRLDSRSVLTRMLEGFE